MPAILRDLKLAVRSMLRAPVFSIAAVLTLAIGIGASTAIFTVLQRVVLDPLPYPDAERLVRLKNQVPGLGTGEEWELASAQYFYLKEHARSIDAIGAYTVGGENLQTDGGAAHGVVASASLSMYRMIGAEVALGRGIGEEDDRPGATPVGVVSFGFWQRVLGGDPQIVGETIGVHGNLIEIVGVMEPGVRLPSERGAPGVAPPDLWLPIASVDARFDPAVPFQTNHVIPMVARLAAGVTAVQAQEEVDRLIARLPEAFPTVYSTGMFDRLGFRTTIYPLKQYVVGSAGESLWILFGAVVLVLLIACANVANLLLVRLEARRRDLAIRATLGAGRGAIARQILTESLVLAITGGALAILLSVWGTEALVAIAPDALPRVNELHADSRVLVAGLLLSLLTTALIAALPILRAGAAGPGANIADGGRSVTAGVDRQRIRSGLVISQVALALILIVGAGLLIRSFQHLRALDPGIDAEGVLTVDFQMTRDRYGDIPSMWRFYDAVLERVRSLPGVTAAGMAQAIPFTGAYGCTVQGFEDERVYERLSAADLTTCAGQVPTTPGYFEAMGIPLVQGRDFTDRDNEQPQTGSVIVSRAFAERFWPGENPIGKGVSPNGRTNQRFYRVVGVVGDVFSSSVTEDPAHVIYYPTVRIPETSGWDPSQMTMAVRTTLEEPLTLVPQIRALVGEVDPAIPVATPRAMSDVLGRSMNEVSFTMVLLGISAGMALVLAGIGLYGTIAYLVARRAGEIGIRVALGAQAGQVQRMVLGGAVRLVAVGLLIGIAGSVLLTRLMQGLLYEVTPADPTAYGAGAMVLLAVALLAAYIPSRRAARVDPAVALRMGA